MADNIADSNQPINSEKLFAELQATKQEMEECKKRSTLIEQLYMKVGGTRSVVYHLCTA